MPNLIRLLLTLLVLVFSTQLAAKPALSRAEAANVRLVSGALNVPANILALRINTPDGPVDLQLTPAAQMQAKAAPMVPAIRNGFTRLYRGTVVGKPSSWARLSLIDDAWLGAVSVDDKLWLLEPAREQPQLAAQLGLGGSDTLVYTMDEFEGLDRLDHGGVMPPAGAISTLKPDADTNSSIQTGADYQYFVGVSLVLDTEFQSHYGANALSTAVGILNIVDGLYSAEAHISVYLHTLEALDDNGPLVDTDSGDLLRAFRTWFRDSSVPFSGVAHLMSGKNFDGSTVGQAWLGSVCSRNYGNGVNQMTFSAAGSAVIFAHEMGHNFSLDHDGDGNSCPGSGFIMNSVTNVSRPPTQFSSCSLDAIDDYLTSNSLSCLTTQPLWIFDSSFE